MQISNNNRPITLPKQQQGAVLLVMLTIFVVGAAYLLLGELNQLTGRIEGDKQTAAALARAKEALIGRAVLDANRPGRLPCPDLDNDGASELFSGLDCPNYTGRLPWRTLGLRELRDGNGDILWYAVSRSFSRRLQPINSDTIGNLTVDGTGGIVAIIFSPGRPIQGQSNRESNNITDYLEDGNSDGNFNFVSSAVDPFNDRLALITHDDLMKLVEKRVGKEVSSILEVYYSCNNYFPWAGPFSNFASVNGTKEGSIPVNTASPVNWGNGCTPTLPSWLTNNNWQDVLYYAVSSEYTPTGGGTCIPGNTCLTVNNLPSPNNDKQAVVITTGRDLTSNRPSTNIYDYLEGENASTGDNIFEKNSPSPSFNDQIFIVTAVGGMGGGMGGGIGGGMGR
jgi:hypothetical protein